MPKHFTIRELQTLLPWSVRYSNDYRSNPQSHKDFAHAITHIVKATGQLAALIDDMDHDRQVADTPDLREKHQKYLADLVICALRAANTFPGGVIDLERVTVERIEVKNGVELPDTGGEIAVKNEIKMVEIDVAKFLSGGVLGKPHAERFEPLLKDVRVSHPEHFKPLKIKLAPGEKFVCECYPQSGESCLSALGFSACSGNDPYGEAGRRMKLKEKHDAAIKDAKLGVQADKANRRYTVACQVDETCGFPLHLEHPTSLNVPPHDHVALRSDQMECLDCGQTWDANDPHPPQECHVRDPMAYLHQYGNDFPFNATPKMAEVTSDEDPDTLVGIARWAFAEAHASKRDNNSTFYEVSAESSMKIAARCDQWFKRTPFISSKNDETAKLERKVAALYQTSPVKASHLMDVLVGWCERNPLN